MRLRYKTTLGYKTTGLTTSRGKYISWDDGVSTLADLIKIARTKFPGTHFDKLVLFFTEDGIVMMDMLGKIKGNLSKKARKARKQKKSG